MISHHIEFDMDKTIFNSYFHPVSADDFGDNASAFSFKKRTVSPGLKFIGIKNKQDEI